MDIRARLRKMFRRGEVVALTATASPRVPTRQGLDSKKQEQFLAQFDPFGARWQGNLAPYIARYAKTPLVADACSDYAMYLVNRGYCYGITVPKGVNFNVIYFDTSRSIVLCKGDLALAVASFQQRSVVRDADGCYAEIVQLQGATLHERTDGRHDERRLELVKLKWERLLVAFLRDQLFANGFDELRIQRAEENRYYNRGTERYLQPEQVVLNRRLRMRYNVTAERMGFALRYPADAAYVLMKKADA